VPYHPESLTHPSQAKTSASTTTQAPWNPIKELSSAHIEMLKLHVQGMPTSRIAYALKRWGKRYSKRQIDRVIQSEKGRQYASLYSAMYYGGMPKFVEAGADHAPEAFHTELSMMQNPLTGERHRLAAAQDVMDRMGPPKISRQETPHAQPTTIVVQIAASQLSQFLSAPPLLEAETILLPDVSSANDDE
jgi:hypothetical protein